MILLVVPEEGCLWTLTPLQKYGGIDHKQSKGGKAGEETVEDIKTTNLPVVRE